MRKMREIVDMVIKEYGEFYPMPGDCMGCDTPYSLCREECLSDQSNDDLNNDSDDENYYDRYYWDNDDDDEEAWDD